MATVPSPNVAQVSGMTPEGASLAQGLAQTELTKNVESFRAGNEQAMQGRQIAASQQQLEQQLKAQRELEEYRGLLEKEKQDKDIAAAKDTLKAQLEAQRQSEMRQLQVRKAEQQVALGLEKLRAERELATERLKINLATGSSEAANQTLEELSRLDEQLVKEEDRLARLTNVYQEMDEKFKQIGTIRPIIDGYVTKEYQNKQKALETASGRALHELVNSLDDEEGGGILSPAEPQTRRGVYPGMKMESPLDFIKGVVQELEDTFGLSPPNPSKEIRKSKAAAQIASLAMELAGVSPDAEGKITNNLNLVLSAMEGAKDPAKVAEGQKALAELRKLGVDGNAISTAISTMAQGFDRIAQTGVVTAPDLIQAGTRADGKQASLLPADPEAMKRKALKMSATFRDTYLPGAAVMGLKISTNPNAIEDWIKAKVAPVTGLVTSLIEDFHADGQIDNTRLLEELAQHSPEARDILMKQIAPIRDSIQTTLWNSSQQGADTQGLFGEGWKGGKVNLAEGARKVGEAKSKVTSLNRQVERTRAFGLKGVNQKNTKSTMDAANEFLQMGSKYNDDLDALGKQFDSTIGQVYTP